MCDVLGIENCVVEVGLIGYFMMVCPRPTNLSCFVHPKQKADSYLHSMLDRATLEWTAAVVGPCADANGLPLPPLLLHVLSG